MRELYRYRMAFVRPRIIFALRSTRVDSAAAVRDLIAGMSKGPIRGIPTSDLELLIVASCARRQNELYQLTRGAGGHVVIVSSKRLSDDPREAGRQVDDIAQRWVL